MCSREPETYKLSEQKERTQRHTVLLNEQKMFSGAHGRVKGTKNAYRGIMLCLTGTGITWSSRSCSTITSNAQDGTPSRFTRTSVLRSTLLADCTRLRFLEIIEGLIRPCWRLEAHSWEVGPTDITHNAIQPLVFMCKQKKCSEISPRLLSPICHQHQHTPPKTRVIITRLQTRIKHLCALFDNFVSITPSQVHHLCLSTRSARVIQLSFFILLILLLLHITTIGWGGLQICITLAFISSNHDVWRHCCFKSNPQTDGHQFQFYKHHTSTSAP